MHRGATSGDTGMKASILNLTLQYTKVEGKWSPELTEEDECPRVGNAQMGCWGFLAYQWLVSMGGSQACQVVKSLTRLFLSRHNHQREDFLWLHTESCDWAAHTLVPILFTQPESKQGMNDQQHQSQSICPSINLPSIHSFTHPPIHHSV